MTTLPIMIDEQCAEPAPQICAQKKGLCIYADARGKTGRVESNSTTELMHAVKRADISWVNFIVDDVSVDGEGVATSLGFGQGIVTALLSSYQYNYEDRDKELGLRIPAVSTDQLDVKVYPLVILMRKGLIVTIHESAITRLVRFSRYAEVFLRKIEPRKLWEDKLTLLLWRIIDENNAKNFDHLRSIEEQADHLVKELMDPQTPREKLGPHIYKMKHALIVYLDALWATLDVINTVRFGDAETLTDDPDLLNRISALYTEVTNQISLSEHMSEVLASGLEVLQSIYNNQLQVLNNKLALVVTWLTVAGTAVLVPNTLATVFGVAAVENHLDEFSTLTLLLVSTVLAAVASYWFVKRKDWVPKQVH